MDPAYLDVGGEGALIDHVMLMDFGAMPMHAYFYVRADDVGAGADAARTDPSLLRRVPGFVPFLRHTIDQLERYRAAFPEDLNAMTVLAVRLFQARQMEECVDVLRRIRELYPLDARSGELFSGILVLRRDHATVGRVVEEVHRTLDALPANPVIRFNLACAQALAGQHDAALEQLRILARTGWDELAYYMSDVDLEPLFADPRFIALQDDALRASRQRINQHLLGSMLKPAL